jgi:site-specific recombinase
MSGNIDELAKSLNKYDFAALSSSDCARALRELLDWLRESSFYSRHQQPLSILRFQRLLRDLEKDKPTKEKIHVLLISTLQFFDISSLLTQTGLSRPHGFFKEFLARSVGRLLPRHSPRPNFMDLLYFLFPVQSDGDFFQKIPKDLNDAILTLFDPGLSDPRTGAALLHEHFHSEILEALLLLSAECLVLSESSLINDIRWALGGANKNHRSFLNLHNFIHRVVHEQKTNSDKNEEDFSELLVACRVELSEIMEHLEQSSLSVDLVYQLEVLQLLLDRIRAMLFIFVFNGNSGPKSLEFFAALITNEQRRRSVRTLINQNLHYLARKIVDNAGETGDHYIARNPVESQELFKAALGGGFLTGFTVLFKILIHTVHLALFFEGFFSAANYAGSFIAMQFTYLTLATKQPAMTAAALAKKMTGVNSDLRELKDELKNLLKSQTIAALGNLCAIVPTAYFLFLVWQLFFNSPIMTVAEAEHLIAAHHPFKSLTFFYSILTGVILWSSSIVHGWVENWMIFRGIPELLSDSFVVENFLSRDKRKRLSVWLKKNLAGITANIYLGVALAYTSVFGSFFGLPLEVRHITLATGSLTIAYASLPITELTASRLFTTFAGIVIILLGNLLVSFALSLWLALKAKGWDLRDVKDVLRSLYRR